MPRPRPATLRRGWNFIAQHRKALVFPALTVVITVLIASQWVERIYVAEAKLKRTGAPAVAEAAHPVIDQILSRDRTVLAGIMMSRSAIQAVVDELGLNDGITDSRERLTYHSLRHAYASWAVMAGVPLYVVGKALGHKTTAMTQRYSHLAPDSHRAASEAVARVTKGEGRADDSNSQASELAVKG